MLVRHAHTDAIGVRLVGRLPGVPLSPAGRLQAERLARALASRPLARIYTSPLERARETAAAIAHAQPVPVTEDDELQEVDFGEWTGRTLAELDGRPEWRRFNQSRGSAPVPGGESALQVQSRILAALRRLAATHAGERIAVVSHGDVIRCAALHFAGLPLDDYARIAIDPASVTTIELGARSGRLVAVNEQEGIGTG